MWPITYTIFGFFMNLTTIVIIKNEILYHTSSCSFKLLYFFKCSYALYCSSTLTLLIVSSIMTLFSAVYASSIFKLLFLLWGLLKCLLLLKFIIWPFLLWFLSVEILTFRFLRLFTTIYISSFLCTAKVHWLWSSILLF